MHYSFSGGLILSLVFLVVAIALPVKLAATFAGASRTGLGWCLASVVVGLLAGYLASAILGNTFGAPFAAFLGFIVGMRLMLGTSLLGALGLSFIAIVLCFVGIAALSYVGIVTSSPVPIAST